MIMARDDDDSDGTAQRDRSIRFDLYRLTIVTIPLIHASAKEGRRAVAPVTLCTVLPRHAALVRVGGCVEVVAVVYTVWRSCTLCGGRVHCVEVVYTVRRSCTLCGGRVHLCGGGVHCTLCGGHVHCVEVMYFYFFDNAGTPAPCSNLAERSDLPAKTGRAAKKTLAAAGNFSDEEDSDGDMQNTVPGMYRAADSDSGM
jgi:hypothetical protein